MRLPFTKVYRAFSEFDSLSDEDCERYVRHVRIYQRGLYQLVPVFTTLTLAISWPVGWVILSWYFPVQQWVPMPDSHDGRLILLVVTSVLVPAMTGLLLRDLALWLGVRDEVNRARCPKCKQSLLGVPVQEVGVGDDPAKRFIRCPECGRKYNLLDIGITPRDLIPFEQRAVDPNFAQKRRRGLD
jgi:DNA-directed RNA polymerase subunit RPC12/RpoP